MENCVICLDTIKEEYKLIGCNHKFHKVCIMLLQDDKCPLCRKNIRNVEVILNVSLNKFTSSCPSDDEPLFLDP